MKERVQVFVTKTGKFRARVQNKSEGGSYEVTIGGESWKNGKGRKYEQEIIQKMDKLMITLNNEHKKNKNNR